MAEYTNIALQTVAAGQNVVFTETPVCGGRYITHREGSGIVTLRGITNQCRARYKVSFGGNVAIPAGGTVAPITLAIALAGEPLGSATMIETPAAVEEFLSRCPRDAASMFPWKMQEPIRSMYKTPT